MRGVNLSGIVGGRFGWDAAWAQGVEAPSYGGESARQAPRDGYAHLFTRLGGARLDGVEPSGASAGRRRDLRSVGRPGRLRYGGVHDVDADEDPTTPAQSDVVVKAGGDALARLGT